MAIFPLQAIIEHRNIWIMYKKSINKMDKNVVLDLRIILQSIKVRLIENSLSDVSLSWSYQRWQWPWRLCSCGALRRNGVVRIYETWFLVNRLWSFTSARHSKRGNLTSLFTGHFYYKSPCVQQGHVCMLWP